MSDHKETEYASTDPGSQSNSPAMSDHDEPDDDIVEIGSPSNSPALSDNDEEYVASVEPKKMTNIEERFKKAEMERPAPNVNKIKMPTFEKAADSDEELNGDVPDEEEAAALREQMWPKNTSSIKSIFENKEISEEEPKEAPQPIDLRAEITDSDQDDLSLQGAYEEEQTSEIQG